MRCKTCDYSLWNLKARQCPECGAEFRPADFEFAPNAVQFCCPHCEQSYYGTNAKGHLIPREFECVRCQRRVDMDDMMLRPAEGVEEERTQLQNMPWLQRRAKRPLRAWWATVGMSLVQPGRLIALTPDQSPLGTALWFAVFTGFLVALLTAIPRLAFVILMMLPMGVTGAMSLGMFAFFGMSVVLLAVMPVIVILTVGLITHGLVRITGSAAHGLGRTYQCLCYSSGANVISAIPCVGLYFGWIWWVVSAVIMLRYGQRIGGVRATFAVLTSTLVALVLWIAAFFLAMAVVLTTRVGGFAAGGAFMMPITDMSETTTMAQEVLSYARASEIGAGPAHALQLVSSSFSAGNFISASSITLDENVQLAGTTLAQIDYLQPNRLAVAMHAAADANGEDLIAHRCGDFVFTYHGIDLTRCNPGLWVVIRWPDPDQNPGAPAVVIAGRADGAPQSMSDSFDRALAFQNQLRAQSNLPPLPHPNTVTHEKPARQGE